MKNFRPLVLQAIALACCCNLSFLQNALSTEVRTKNNLSKQAVRNSSCFIFNIGEGPNYAVKLRQGRFKNGAEQGLLSDEFFAQGLLDGEPAAVAFVTWTTGGSGCWEELALFRLRKGKTLCSGIYSLEDRATINKLSIHNNAIVLDWLKHADGDSAPAPSKPEVLHLKSSQFEKCGP